MKRIGGVATALMLVATVAAGAASAMPAPGNTAFPRYKELEPNVAFWHDVFRHWTSKQIVFHDVEHLDLVYSVLSIDDIVTRLPHSQQEGAIRARRKAEAERIAAMLDRIAAGHARTEEERRVLKAVAKIGYEPSYAAKLADQVRSQRGLGDKFCEAMDRARHYEPMMRRTLAAFGVPEELVALPLVESGYQIGAFSSVGAAGIWQFMPSTGRLYLDINQSYDDRRDPQRATEAAAKLLRKSYDVLGSWPLAITSYNHGLGGVANAVKSMGTTHFGVISRHYKGKTFGFASRNFYAEFLAAHDAVAEADEVCGAYTGDHYQPDEVVVDASVSLRDLARSAGVATDALAAMNPALRDAVVRGSQRVPRGYRLNLPKGAREDFLVAYGKVDRATPSSTATIAKASTGSGGTRTHRIQRGQTLSQIASRYGTSTSALMRMNNLRSAHTIRAGQNLKVPGPSPAEPTSVASAAALAAKTAAAAVPAAVIAKTDEPASPKVVAQPHRVGKGQTLSQIAAMYKTDVATLMRLNGIRDARRVQAGQSLQVPMSGSAIAAAAPVGGSHRVRSGDTLWSLARANGTSVETLKRLNPRVAQQGLKIGDVIKVPAGGTGASTASRSSFATHRVLRGQTLSAIAAKYGSSVDAIKRANGIRDPRKVRVGQTLKVPL